MVKQEIDKRITWKLKAIDSGVCSAENEHTRTHPHTHTKSVVITMLPAANTQNKNMLRNPTLAF